LFNICLFKKNYPREKTGNPFYDIAFDYKDEGRIDSSFSYFYKAKDIFLQQKDSFGVGKCLANLAIIQETKGDYYGSQETGLNALKYLNESDSLTHIYLSINYNTLGMLSSKLKNYERAIDFYKKAISFTNDSINKNIYINNLANNYRRNKNYDTAVEILSSLLPKTNGDYTSYSRVLDNLAYSKFVLNSNYNPIPEFHKALKIRLKEKIIGV
jgi:tetratricopeptide (TPR) repeat protein